MHGLRSLNLRFRAYGWLYIVLMDLALEHCIRAFEGCGRGRDLNFFARRLLPPHSQFASDAYVLYQGGLLKVWEHLGEISCAHSVSHRAS